MHIPIILLILLAGDALFCFSLPCLHIIPGDGVSEDGACIPRNGPQLGDYIPLKYLFLQVHSLQVRSIIHFASSSELRAHPLLCYPTLHYLFPIATLTCSVRDNDCPVPVPFDGRQLAHKTQQQFPQEARSGVHDIVEVEGGVQLLVDGLGEASHGPETLCLRGLLEIGMVDFEQLEHRAGQRIDVLGADGLQGADLFGNGHVLLQISQQHGIGLLHSQSSRLQMKTYEDMHQPLSFFLTSLLTRSTSACTWSRNCSSSASGQGRPLYLTSSTTRCLISTSSPILIVQQVPAATATRVTSLSSPLMLSYSPKLAISSRVSRTMGVGLFPRFSTRTTCTSPYIMNSTLWQGTPALTSYSPAQKLCLIISSDMLRRSQAVRAQKYLFESRYLQALSTYSWQSHTFRKLLPLNTMQCVSTRTCACYPRAYILNTVSTCPTMSQALTSRATLVSVFWTCRPPSTSTYMQSGESSLAQRSSPGWSSRYSAVRQNEMNFSDWQGKKRRKKGIFWTNFVSSTPSKGMRSCGGLETILMMFMASGFILFSSIRARLIRCKVYIQAKCPNQSQSPPNSPRQPTS